MGGASWGYRAWRCFGPPRHFLHPAGRVVSYAGAVRSALAECPPCRAGLLDPGEAEGALGRVAGLCCDAVLSSGGWVPVARVEEALRAEGLDGPVVRGLLEWAEGDGLLVRRDGEVAFAAEEARSYLAAARMATAGDPDGRVVYRLRYGWEEVFPLAVAYTDRILGEGEAAANLVQAAAWGQEPPFEGTLALSRLQAGRCMAEGVVLPDDLASALLGELVGMWNPTLPRPLQEGLAAVLAAVARDPGSIGEATRAGMLDVLDTYLERLAGLHAEFGRRERALDAGVASALDLVRGILAGGDGAAKGARHDDEGPVPDGAEEGDEDDLAACEAAIQALSFTAELILLILAHGVEPAPTLLDALRERFSRAPGNAVPFLRGAVCVALGRAGVVCDGVVALLDEAARDEEPAVRHMAARAIADLGQGSPVLLDALGRLLKDAHPLVRKGAVSAAGRLLAEASAGGGPGHGIPAEMEGLRFALAALLGEPSVEARMGGAEALRDTGLLAAAAPVAEYLRELASEDPWRRVLGGLGLALVGSDLPDAAAALLGGLVGLLGRDLDPGHEDREAVEEALADALACHAEGSATTREVLLALLRREPVAELDLDLPGGDGAEDGWWTPASLASIAAALVLERMAGRWLERRLAPAPGPGEPVPEEWRWRAVETAVKALEVGDPPVGSSLVSCLASFGRGEAWVAKGLLEMVDEDGDPDALVTVASALGAAGVATPEAAAFLGRGLDTFDADRVVASLCAIEGLATSEDVADVLGRDLLGKVEALASGGIPEYATPAYRALAAVVRAGAVVGEAA